MLLSPSIFQLDFAQCSSLEMLYSSPLNFGNKSFRYFGLRSIPQTELEQFPLWILALAVDCWDRIFRTYHFTTIRRRFIGAFLAGNAVPEIFSFGFGAFLRQSLSRVHLWTFALAVGCWDRIFRSPQISADIRRHSSQLLSSWPEICKQPLPVLNYPCYPDRSSPPDNFDLYPPLGHHALAEASLRTSTSARRCPRLVLAAHFLLGARARPSD